MADRKIAYIDNIKRTLDEYNRPIYVYGAGKVARNIFFLLKNANLSVDGFIVTSPDNNVSKLEGIRVYGINDFCRQNIDVILIMGFAYKSDTVISEIRQCGFDVIIPFYDFLLKEDSWSILKYNSPVMEITTRIGCAVNCRYCPQTSLVNEYLKNDNKRDRVLSLEKYKYYLDKMPANTIIDWSGFSEPFLNDYAIDMMRHTAETGHTQTLYTTLEGLSVEQLPDIVNIPFEWVVLHTADKYGYAHIAVDSEYLEKIKYIVNAKKKNGKKFVDTANCQFDPDERVTDITKGRLKIYTAMQDRAGNLKNDDDRLISNYVTGDIECMSSKELNHNVLLPDGTVVLCCSDFGLKYVLGNLNENSYEEIINSDVIKDVMRKSKSENEGSALICRRCMYAKGDK